MKLVAPEQGSAEVAAAWLDAERRVSSLLLYPETRAAIARARRMGRFRRTQLSRASRHIEALWAAIDRIEPTEELARRAGDLAEEHGLRGYDAVHLASFEEIADDQTVLVATDGDLVTAARTRGFFTLPLPA